MASRVIGFPTRLTVAQPGDWSSDVTSSWRRSMWRLSVGGGPWLRRRSHPRRSRITVTSLRAPANTCLTNVYAFSSVHDTMKRNCAMVASAYFQPPGSTQRTGGCPAGGLGDSTNVEVADVLDRLPNAGLKHPLDSVRRRPLIL